MSKTILLNYNFLFFERYGYCIIVFFVKQVFCNRMLDMFHQIARNFASSVFWIVCGFCDMFDDFFIVGKRDIFQIFETGYQFF